MGWLVTIWLFNNIVFFGEVIMKPLEGMKEEEKTSLFVIILGYKECFKYSFR